MNLLSCSRILREDIGSSVNLYMMHLPYYVKRGIINDKEQRRVYNKDAILDVIRMEQRSSIELLESRIVFDESNTWNRLHVVLVC